LAESFLAVCLAVSQVEPCQEEPFRAAAFREEASPAVTLREEILAEAYQAVVFLAEEFAGAECPESKSGRG